MPTMGVRARLMVLYASFFLWIFALALVMPHVTPVAVNTFAGAVTGNSSIKCDGVKDQDVATSHACTSASATAVVYTAITGFVSNALLGLLVAPLTSWLSDAYGRKPFFIAALGLSAGPPLWFYLYLVSKGQLSFPVYYLLDSLRGAIIPLTLVLSATADEVRPGQRAWLFSLIMVEMSVAMILAAGVGGLLVPSTAALTSVTISAVNIAGFTFLMPETLPESTKCATRADRQATGGSQLVSGWLASCRSGLRESFAVLTRSKLFFKLALIMAASGVVFECIQELLFNYLILTLRFDASDNATVLVTLGVSSLLVQALLLPGLLRVMSEKWVLLTALLASTVQMVGFAAAPRLGAWAVYTAVVVGAPGSMALPIISSIKSCHAGADEQGKVQGALFAARGFAQGMGPLLFSAMFTFFTKQAHYFPEAPIVCLAAIMAGGAIVAYTMHVPAPRAEIPAEEQHKEGLHSTQEECVELLNSERSSPVPTTPVS